MTFELKTKVRTKTILQSLQDEPIQILGIERFDNGFVIVSVPDKQADDFIEFIQKEWGLTDKDYRLI